MFKINKKILLVYIEPTPYVLGLIEALVNMSDSQLDILFLKENKSQNWNIVLDKKWKILPHRFPDKIRLIKKLIFHGNYNLIHVAGWGDPFALLFIFLTKLTGKFLTVETDTPIPHQIKAWKRVIKRMMYPFIFRLVNIFLPGGTRQAKYLEHYGVQPERIVPAQMTVDVVRIERHVAALTQEYKLYLRKQYGLPESSVIFLFVGRLMPHKGVRDLLTIFNDLNVPEAIVLFVGDGPLCKDIQMATKNKKIYYAGRLSGTDLIEIYYAADVLVLPSHNEPWGLVVNEAMAAGLPVIVSDRVGCADDLVKHEQSGIITKAECLDELQRAIEDMVNEPDKRRNMSHQAKKIIANWTLENEAKIMHKVWNNLLCA